MSYFYIRSAEIARSKFLDLEVWLIKSENFSLILIN